MNTGWAYDGNGWELQYLGWLFQPMFPLDGYEGLFECFLANADDIEEAVDFFMEESEVGM
jgi:hypothetical protein